MEEKILYTTDNTPIYLSKKRYSIAKRYTWHVQSDGKGGKTLVTYFNGKSYYFTSIVFGQRIRRKDMSIFDYTRRNILGYGQSGRTASFGRYLNNTSGYKYVYKSGEKWSVSIRINNVLHYKGKFSEKEDAAVVADYWSYSCSGINAYSNFKWGSRRTLTKRCREILIKNGYSVEEIKEL